MDTKSFFPKNTLQNFYNFQHLEEWRKSANDDEVIRLNYLSFEDESEAIARLTYGLDRSDYLNSGRLKTKYLIRLKHLKHGSWGAFGEDVLIGEESLWGQVKPNQPRSETKCAKGGTKKLKEIKYESPRKTQAELFAPKPSLNHWRKISDRFDLEMPVDIPVSSEGWARGMYDWIKAHPEIPIILGEGAKKAGALISHGYPVLAGAGIWMLRRQEKDDWGNKVDAPYLIPQIECFATEGREFIFAFDNDDKPSTRENVRKAITATAELLTAKGCSASVVFWSDESEKGVDDLIAAQGIKRFDRAVRERISVDKYNFNFFKEKQQEEYRKNRKFTPQIEIDQEFIEVDFSAPNTIYLLDSALGTGKTSNLIKNLIKQRDKGMIMANYRNTLCLNFNERGNEIGFYHYQSDKELEELSLDDPGIKVSLCIDSLSNFDSEQFDNKIIILDEVVSVIKHLLNSPTIRDFGLIKNLFSEMIRRSDCVICLDGNMQDWVTKFVSTLAPNKQIVSLKNVYQGGRADVVMLDGVIKNEKVLKDTRSPYVNRWSKSIKSKVVRGLESILKRLALRKSSSS